MGSPWHIAHNAMRGRAHLKGKSLDRRIVGRVWTFARPYRRMIIGFLATIVAASLIGIVPPLILKGLIDMLRSNHRSFGSVNRLAAVALALAIGDAARSGAERS